MEKKDKQGFSVKKRISSFGYAFNGFKILFKEEHNARIHLIVSVFVIAAGLFFDITATEWLFIIFAIALVFSLEIINSALENLADAVSQDYNELIKKAKDLSAAAVLLSATASVVIGIIIFLPKILNLFGLL